MSACTSCGAEVRFERHHRTGRWMILDVDPCEDGNIVLMGGAAVFTDAEAARKAAGAGRPRYKDHHTTCPASAEWHEKAKQKRQEQQQMSLGGDEA